MSLDPTIHDRIANLIDSSEVMLFMKGNRAAPQCGFSATVVGILDTLAPEYETFDVLSDPIIRDGIKEYSTWPTIPQLYVNGEFIGGCDIIQELCDSGELAKKFGIDLSSVTPPTIQITDEAAAGLREAVAGANPGQSLHLGIDARFQSSLSLGPSSPNQIEIEANGISLRMDILSSRRADGLSIDVVDTPQGKGFKIDNPNAPRGVEPMSVRDLKQRLDAGESFELIDVRPLQEHEIASIPSASLLSPELAERLEALPKDAMLVFHCHHGGRSQSAAEHFVGLGFTNVWNVEGGIDAWSTQIDPSVPRY